jgi:hypothetical protein
MMSEPTVDPLDQMEGEPVRWHARAVTYIEMGSTRSVNAVWQAENVGKGRKVSGVWYEMAERWKWSERARAWDRQEYEQRRFHLAAALEIAYAAQAKLAEVAMAHATVAIEGIDPKSLTLTERIRLAEFAIELQRTSLAEPLELKLEREIAELREEIEGDKANKPRGPTYGGYG